MSDQTMQPEEISEDEVQARQAQLERLDAFSDTIRKLRQVAVDARKQMGIEDQWQEDEDHYEAIDDANRTTSARIKPYDFGGTGAGGPTRLPESSPTRSTVFVPMTRPYVDMASALIADLYLPTDDRNWDGEPTPVPNLIKQAGDTTPLMQAQPTGQPSMMDRIKGMFGAPAQAPAQPDPSQPQTVGDLAQQEIDKADAAWEKARTIIDDQLLECAYNAEMRKVIKDMARIGVGIMKGPFPKPKSSKAVVKTPDGYAIEIQQKTIPASKRVDPWRFFPDPACGEDINNGSYVFEEDAITRSKLRDLRKLDSYIGSQIDKCLEEGPVSASLGTKKTKSDARTDSDLFQIWYFEGQVEWQDLNDAGCVIDGQKGDVFHAVVTMVNDRVIKAALSHLDSEEFTYDVSVWQRKSGLWIGDGVGRQGRTAQRGLNAAVRNLMDNAGRSSRPHTVFNRKAIVQGADPYTWYTKADADVQQIAHAMMFFNVPSMQAELMAIIQYFSKMFEDATGLPMMMQGQQGSAPETVGGMQLLMNNAAIVPRDIVRRLDDNCTEPHIKRYYEYLMMHGEDDSAKGDFNIHARGSSALMERAAQDKFLLELVQYAPNPAYELDPALLMQELLRSVRINPKRVTLSDEKKKEMASRPQPEDPRITAAKIMAGASVQRVVTQGQVDAKHYMFDAEQAQQAAEQGKSHELQMAQYEQSVEASRANAEDSRANKEMMIAQQNGQYKIEELRLKERLALLQYAQDNKISLQDAQVALADRAMQEKTRRSLGAAEIELAASENEKNRGLDLHKHTTSLIRDEISTPNTP
jgi:hypothetical protein